MSPAPTRSPSRYLPYRHLQGVRLRSRLHRAVGEGGSTTWPGGCCRRGQRQLGPTGLYGGKILVYKLLIDRDKRIIGYQCVGLDDVGRQIVTTAHLIQNKLKGRMTGIGVGEVWEKIQAGEQPFFLDGRNPNEYEEMHLGIGETLIPSAPCVLGWPNCRRTKTPNSSWFCKISLRGYEAECILRAHGYTNVKVMEGGIMAWPYPRKK